MEGWDGYLLPYKHDIETRNSHKRRTTTHAQNSKAHVHSFNHHAMKNRLKNKAARFNCNCVSTKSCVPASPDHAHTQICRTAVLTRRTDAGLSRPNSVSDIKKKKTLRACGDGHNNTTSGPTAKTKTRLYIKSHYIASLHGIPL